MFSDPFIGLLASSADKPVKHACVKMNADFQYLSAATICH